MAQAVQLDWGCRVGGSEGTVDVAVTHRALAMAGALGVSRHGVLGVLTFSCSLDRFVFAGK